jgi:hypothetical protein
MVTCGSTSGLTQGLRTITCGMLPYEDFTHAVVTTHRLIAVTRSGCPGVVFFAANACLSLPDPGAGLGHLGSRLTAARPLLRICGMVWHDTVWCGVVWCGADP